VGIFPPGAILKKKESEDYFLSCGVSIDYGLVSYLLALDSELLPIKTVSITTSELEEVFFYPNLSPKSYELIFKYL